MNNILNKQKGTVIITVLMLVAVATYLAVEMTYRQRVDITRTGTLLALSQSEEYVKSAEALAQYVLEQDLKGDIKDADLSDHKQEDWPTKVVKPIGRGLVQGEIIDLQGRFNLNKFLLTTTPTSGSEYKEQFIALLGALGIPSSSTNGLSAAVIAERVVDWVDVGNQPETGGLETLDYQLLDPPYQAGNRILVDLSELLLVTGVSAADLDKMADYVSILPPSTPVNINTASENVLALTGCLSVSAIVSARESGPITKDDITKMSSTGSSYVDAACADGVPEGTFSSNSEFFLLKAKSEVDKKTIHMNSVLYRQATETASDVKVKVILRKHLDPFSGV